MCCEHKNGGLRLFTYEQNTWLVRCLRCGDEQPADTPAFPTESGTAACAGFLHYAQRRFSDAAACFHQAAVRSGDGRYHFAALLCRYGVTWCGDESQPTFGAYPLPAEAMHAAPEWQAVGKSAPQLGSAVYMNMSSDLAQLDEILSCIRRREGLSACDVFLCYRRTNANVQSALRLYRDLTAQHLRVFCADVTTRGKTQEQFEAEVYHALNTAEHLVLLPGEGADALTPWLRNELSRAAAAPDKRFVCTGSGLSEKLGELLPMEDIRTRLIAAASDAAPNHLYQRALAALRSGHAAQASALLQRASAKEHAPARLLSAELYAEGLLFPADQTRSEHYRRLAGSSAEAFRQQVNHDLLTLEEALHITRRQAMIHLVADVSDAGFAASQTLTRALISALNADRRLARSDMCVIGYDRHARILAAPKPLAQYGLPEDAARTLRTTDDSCGAAYAAKGLRCAVDHLLHSPSAAGREPAVILLRPCLTADAESSLSAGWLALESIVRHDAAAEICSADQLEDCIARLRALVQ